MWYFKSAADENRKFLLLPGKEYVIGRHDCDIAIENDQSVSRKHAILSVSHPEVNVTNVNKPSSLILKDVSKFGTLVNNHKVKGELTLRDGDEVRFGTPKSVHRVEYEPFIVALSCVDGTAKKQVRSLVCQLGGHVSSDWRKDCGFLVMQSVTVTIKVVCALVSQKPIVTVEYLRDLVSFYKGRTADRPQPEKYLPPVTERLIEPGVSFHANVKRSRVFQGMSFYFLSDKQFRKLNVAVELGGGVPILLDSPQGADLEAFLEDNTVVMNPASGDVVNQEQKEWVRKVRSFLSRRGKFMVQDAEVGYAALYASTDTYCNSDKDVSHLLLMALPSQTLTQAGSLSSQPVSTQRESSSSQGRLPGFKVPPVPGDGARPVPSGRGDEARGKSWARTRHDDDKGSGEKEEKEEEVSTLPESESLTEGSVRIKSERQAGGEMVRSSASHGRPLSGSQPSESKKAVTVKAEEEELGDHSRALYSEQPSETLPNTEVMSLAAMKDDKDRTDKKPVLWLGDEDDDDLIQTTKTSSLKYKRRFQKFCDDDEEEDPFSLVQKRPKQAATRAARSPQRSTSSGPEEQQKASRPPSKHQHKGASSAVLQDLQDPEGDSLDEEDVNPFDFEVGRGKKQTSHHVPPAQSRKRAARSPSPASAPKKGRSSRRSPSPLSPASAPKKGRSSRRSPSPPSPASAPKKGRSSRKSPSPKPSSGPGSAFRKGEGDDSDPELSAFSETERTSRSPSPRPRRPHPQSRTKPTDSAELSARDPDRTTEPSLAAAPSARSPSSISSQHAHSASSAPVPDGFLTTRKPIRDQVAVNPKFEKEDINAPAMTVQFQDLVRRREEEEEEEGGRSAGREDQCNLPHGMMRWKGKTVPNFKKFRKTKHAGADRLPRIIGGRDLEEHCRSANKMMEDWLKELTDAESQQQERDRETERLFEFQPASRGRKSRR